MLYIVLALLSFIILAGGGKGYLSYLRMRPITVFSWLIAITLISAVPAFGRQDLKLYPAGLVYLIIITVLGFKHSKLADKLYIVSVSVILAFTLYFVAEMWSRLLFGAVDKNGILYFAAFLFAVMLLSFNPSNALFIAAYSSFGADIIYAAAGGESITLFASGPLTAALSAGVLGSVILYKIFSLVFKLYPLPDFMLSETAEYFETERFRHKKGGDKKS